MGLEVGSVGFREYLLLRGFLKMYFVCGWVLCLHFHLCIMCAWFCRVPEKASDLLELKLQIVMSHYVSAENPT